jgi:hypothetical protein
MRAYNGPDWESSTIRGESNVLLITLFGGGPPPSHLWGLQPFQVLPIPEPSSLALFGLGLPIVLFWLRREKQRRAAP